jgi:adenylylsulfate kinase
MLKPSGLENKVLWTKIQPQRGFALLAPGFIPVHLSFPFCPLAPLPLNNERKVMNNGFTLWFTGLPCSGKTTVAEIVAQELLDRGLKVEILDGDIVRQEKSPLNPPFSKVGKEGFDFNKEDEYINIRCIGFASKLLSRNGVAVVAAYVSPYRVIRDELRQDIENFVEAYVKCPVEVCMERDVKGMYKKSIAEEIPISSKVGRGDFTGILDLYEEPENPEVVVETDKETPEESAQKVIETLEELGYISQVSDVVYSDEEEEQVKNRLKALGYI